MKRTIKLSVSMTLTVMALTVLTLGIQAAKALPTQPININTATADELTALPNVGPKTAEAIVAYRAEHGPFAKPEDLMAVKGIGEKTFEKMKPYVTTGGWPAGGAD